VMLWASSGKPLTAVMIAALVERGVTRFSQRVSEIVSEFGQGGKESLTIEHLLTHTAGFRAADQISPENSWETLLQRVCATPMEQGWVPGEKAGYQTGSSWLVLGEVIQRLTGRSFAEAIQEMVFSPLDMSDCWSGIPVEAQLRYEASGRLGKMVSTELGGRRARLTETREGMAASLPGSNLRGPIRALGRFYEKLMAAWEGIDGFVVKPDMARRLVERRRVGMFDETFRHVIDWGLGFIVNSNRYGVETAPYSFGRQASESAVGHSGAQASTGFMDPERGLVVAWVLNGMPGERRHQIRARELNSAIYRDAGL
jgi:CubicO group peptidase (beta-lactamase class C family)